MTTPTDIVANIKMAASYITAVAAIVGSLWAFDSHYASADEVHGLKQDLSMQIIQLRTMQLEDELFKLDVKSQSGSKLTPLEEAMKNRYNRQLKMNTEQMNSMHRTIQ